jgi:hypothetical protein
VRSPEIRAAIATKHGKEALFAPAFARLGVDVFVADVDTDEFGTFAGEIEREGTAVETVERKARAAIHVTGAPIGLASEGSFGPHPGIPFALVDTECVAWLDDANDHLVIERASEVTRIPAAASISDVDEVDSLRISTLMPDQAAIVVSEFADRRSRRVHAKGITEVDELRAVVAEALAASDGTVIVEPDLRAHLCPDRRAVITSAVQRLVTRLACECPQCAAPGFGPVRTIPGRPCALCGLPTTLPAIEVLSCTRCGSERERAFTATADPTHCDRCNP